MGLIMALTGSHNCESRLLIQIFFRGRLALLCCLIAHEMIL